MTVSTQTLFNEYTGNGIEDTFAFGFRILDEDHINVTVDDVAQTLNVDYTVENVTASGGDIVFGTPPADTLAVYIERDTPRTQETVYNEYDPFPAAAHEEALDKLTMSQQEFAQRLVIVEAIPAAVGSLANVVEDTTPQLGGDLDLNSNDVTGTGNLDITGGIDITGILEVAGTAPQMPRLVESDAAADEGGWYGYANGGTLRWPITRRDSGAAGQWFFEFDRTGYLADSITVGGEVDDIFLNNTELSDFSFRDHKAVANTPNISSGVATLDYSTGPAFTIELDENVTSWTLSNIPAGFYFIEIIIRLYQDQTGGRTVAWTGFTNLKWPGGVAPTITATAATGSGIDDAFPDIISMKSFDGGGNWYGDYSIGYAA